MTATSVQGDQPITLRIEQSALGASQHRVAVRLDQGQRPLEAVSDFTFRLSTADREDVRWYLEDYLSFPQEAAPQVAARVERRLAELGTQLFQRVFGADDAREIWGYVRSRLARVRVEVSSDVAGATVLPWELLRDPGTGLTTALQVESFVRVNDGSATPIVSSADDTGPLRVLLVICRPEAANDVPFRSVTGHLVRLRGSGSDVFQLDVLRPPTFLRLIEVLDSAWQAGWPYHAVHFDGHGTYVADQDISPDKLFSPPRPGPHGYLVFEEPTNDDNVLFIDGPTLGSLLVRTGVSMLVLNACRSAYAAEPEEPFTRFATMYSYAREPNELIIPTLATRNVEMIEMDDSIRSFVRHPVPAYSSLALEAAAEGVAGVVAMRYSVYVATAAQFVANLYDALLAGQALGAAATSGRRQLAAQPNRTVGFDPRPLQDWSVPVVYEAKPLSLFASRDRSRGSDAHTGTLAREANLVGFPQPPDTGFFGRDESLLALDRAFDSHSIVLLQGCAGSGKTATAAEFARWYLNTGGLTSPMPNVTPVLFTSLEHRTRVGKIIEVFGEVFHVLLDRDGVDWGALDDVGRRQVTLETLSTVPVLWIWDSVENVNGFPPGVDSQWSEAEQQDLLDLLRDLATAGAKILLTSRRDEQTWLGDLPVRIHMSPMPMNECIQLAEALSANHGHRIDDINQWRSLLGFAAGNPLTVRVLVRQALRERLTQQQSLEFFITRLIRGEAEFADDTTLGRAESLGASLDYGFKNAFSRQERAQLAVLHLFQSSVDVAALTSIGDPSNAASLPELAELNRPVAIALLDRTAETGLLGKIADGRYSLHPGVPWYFGRLYAETYGPRERHDRIVLNAYTAAIARHARQRAQLYRSGHADVIMDLASDETNLLNARLVAARGGRWQEVMGCMHGLRVLYRHIGLNTQWAALLREFLAEPAIAGLADENVDDWRELLDFQVELARDRRDWNQAEWLISTVIDRDRERATSALAADPENLTDSERDRLRWLAASVVAVGNIMRERRDPECLRFYAEAGELYHRIDDSREEYSMASHRGDAYVTVPEIRDLNKAEELYQIHLKSLEDHDWLSRARVFARLGRVAHERFLDARSANHPEEELGYYLNQAADAISMAFRLTPSETRNERASLHDAIGTIFTDADRVNSALYHYRIAIAIYDETDRYQAARTRLNVARALARGNRTPDALNYAHAAVRDFESEGAANMIEIEEARRLIENLELGPTSAGDSDDPDDGLGGVLAAL